VIISRTPLRVSSFGGGTDYPEWYRRHGGAVLATTINKYCYLTCRYLPPFFNHRIRIVYSKIENCQSIDEIGHPAVREILRHLGMDRGVEIHHDGDLPARSGVGSSSSFTVGLLHALYALRGHIPSRRQLATESIQLEQERLKETVGSQDQVLAAYGGFNHVRFLPSGDFTVTPMTLPPDRLRELNDHLMLVFTGVNRTSSEVADSYVRELRRMEAVMRATYDMVAEGIAILTGMGDLSAFGKLLHASWLMKRSLSAAVSSPLVEDLYEAALAAGALGGKLVGAGGGGFMLLFVPPGQQQRLRDRLRTLIHVPFALEYSGSQIIFYEPEQDYAAAEQDRARFPVGPFQEAPRAAGPESA
jgi:D-glycero-alpha-D-manno-heptose-7-phosphate kinase